MNQDRVTKSCQVHFDIQLSLCMIVKDAARTLDACLTSVRPWVDEMVVVDTGSNDGTIEIARRHGARLFNFPWRDSFALARNVSLEHARGEWIFWTDADDTIDPANGQKLRSLSRQEYGDNLLGHVLQVQCPEPSSLCAGGMTVVDHVKVIRNHSELRFDGRIHEQILPAIRRAGGRINWTDIFVTHSGHDYSDEGQAKKNQRDLRLLALELEDHPDHPFVLFNLGMTHANVGDQRSAIHFLERCVAVADPTESQLPKAYALLAASHIRLENYEAAWDATARGRRLFPGDPELLFRYGSLAHHFRRLEEAKQTYLAILNGVFVPRFASIDRGIFGVKTRQNLAWVYSELGELEKAEELWRRICDELPQNAAAWQAFGETLLRRGKFAEADRIANRMLAHESLHSAGQLLKARCARARGDVPSVNDEVLALEEHQ